jgi:hypothetical protein
VNIQETPQWKYMERIERDRQGEWRTAFYAGIEVGRDDFVSRLRLIDPTAAQKFEDSLRKAA